MGETPADTLKEIEETRERLDGRFQQLEQRLPSTLAALKRTGALVAVVGMLGTVARVVLRSRRKRAGDRRMHDLEDRLDRLERRLDD
jgi:hypothetical protein